MKKEDIPVKGWLSEYFVSLALFFVLIDVLLYLFLSFFVIRLEEAEEKYRSRQSRPEDLEIIDQLKRALAERELDMKKLVVSAAWFIIIVIGVKVIQELS